uniref:Retinal cone rhodopsin-sensitive cGMP 3',5'-cyclic phosphodiesterase subunit gamma n=1 Tax=Gouania willdenowi TaxID=441366 RepID=A0A8C5HE54_GOUWI
MINVSLVTGSVLSFFKKSCCRTSVKKKTSFRSISQRTVHTFKSKAPKPGQKGFGDDIPGMEGLGTDFSVVCPWEAFGDMELSDLAKYGII